MKKILILTLTLLLTLPAGAQVVRSGSTQRVRVKKEKPTKEPSPGKNALGLTLNYGWDYTNGLTQHRTLNPNFDGLIGPWSGPFFPEAHYFGSRLPGVTYQRDLRQGRLDFTLFVENFNPSFVERHSYEQGWSWEHGIHSFSAVLMCTYQKSWWLSDLIYCYAGAGLIAGYGETHEIINDRRYIYFSPYEEYRLLYKEFLEDNQSSGFDFGLACVAGVEYRFEKPFVLSFDIRPQAHFIDFTTPLYRMTLNLGLKYTF